MTKLFIHIPKTGGTSLRVALVNAVGKSNIANDYGPNSSETSESVRRVIYSSADHPPKVNKERINQLLEEIRKKNTEFLCGHFWYRKYANHFPNSEVITFIREPLARTASEYLHEKRHKRLSTSFQEYARDRKNRNIQSKYLEGCRDGAFIGLTEMFSAHLRVLGEQLGLNLKNERLNLAPRGGALEFVKTLSFDQVDEFYKLNRRDVILYRETMRRLES